MVARHYRAGERAQTAGRRRPVSDRLHARLTVPRHGILARMRRPTAEDLRAAANQAIPDLIAPDLRVLFVGINPGLYSGATGLHFARPGNRFWPALHGAGFTPRLLAPDEGEVLLGLGIGITNIVNRTTATAAELDQAELVAGGRRLEANVETYRPWVVAVLGVTAYRAAFGRAKAVVGRQAERIGEAELWVLPNPSGLNAHYQLPGLIELFRAFREDAGLSRIATVQPIPRPATTDDVSAITALVAAAYGGYEPLIGRTPMPMLVDYVVAVSDHQIWVIDDAGATTGLAGILELVVEPDHLWIENVAIAPECQGRGLGRLLLEHAETEARRQGLQELGLLTNERYLTNIAMYERYGYRETHRTPHKGTDLVHFRKRLAR